MIPYEIIGDVAVIKSFLVKATVSTLRAQAEIIMERNPHVKTVLYQTAPVIGEYRTRGLKWILGKRKTNAIYKENGCLFRIDLPRVYFSPRLSFERMRLARLVRPNEIVVNMFAGTGPFSIVIARHSLARLIYSIDLSPAAVDQMIDNIGLNKVAGRVVPILGDAAAVVKKDLRGLSDRVLMPLPERSFEYLPYALMALRNRTGCIHYYDFTHARKTEEPVDLVKGKVSKKLESLDVRHSMSLARIVRKVGPNWYQVVLDVEVG
ncbi:MAG: class I SAM-dependent methyltransferase family protein [Candidatus Bathyarchaeia archaeon]